MIHRTACQRSMLMPRLQPCARWRAAGRLRRLVQGGIVQTERALHLLSLEAGLPAWSIGDTALRLAQLGLGKLKSCIHLRDLLGQIRVIFSSLGEIGGLLLVMNDEHHRCRHKQEQEQVFHRLKIADPA